MSANRSEAEKAPLMPSDDVRHIKALRRAFVEGTDWQSRRYLASPSAREVAEQRYPLPTVTVPRVARMRNGVDYRVVNGELEARDAKSGAWFPAGSYHIEDVRILSDLLANPTERVEATE